MLKGRHDEARHHLLKLHTPEEAAIEIVQIQRQMEIDAKLDNSYWAMFAKPSYRKRTLIGMTVTACIQFSGILVINSKFHTITTELHSSLTLIEQTTDHQLVATILPSLLGPFRADKKTDLRWTWV